MQRAFVMVIVILAVVTTAVMRVKDQRLHAELEAARGQIVFLERQVTTLQSEKNKLAAGLPAAAPEVSASASSEGIPVPSTVEEAVQARDEALRRAEGLASQLMQLRAAPCDARQSAPGEEPAATPSA